MGNKSARGQAAVDVEDVGLSVIPTWESYFETNEEKVINCLPSKGGDFEWDEDINKRVSIYKGDITCLEVDGIVSASNSDLIATGGVSAKIVAVAGTQLENELMKMNGCETGKAKVTPGYQLPARYVIHAVGPEKEDTALLESCYKSCLNQMQLNHMKSLAFCCISTGSYGYAQYKAVLIALKTVRSWLEELKQNSRLSEIDRIVFCLYTSTDLNLYESWMQVYFPCCPRIEMDLLPLPGYVKITVTEPDMLGLDDGRRQAKMPCGHVIGPDSMTEYCRQILKSGGFQFFCPSTEPDECDAQWEYFIVRHVARLTPEELTEFEKKIAENYLMKGKGMHRCPGCSTWCYRASGVGAAVRCPLCTAKQGGQPFDFCWWCDLTWLTSTSNPPCGNPGCDGTDRRLHILANCPTKLIDNCPDCPSIRGCPSCGILIEHIQDCGHMACSNCPGYGFCFICLKETVNGEWQCQPYRGTCTLVPRQTTLPGSE